jgi:polysaccharide biosynthesis PFTS motif protein
LSKNLILLPLIKIIKRVQRARLRRIMRSYRLLKQSGHLDRIAAVKRALTEHSLGLSGQQFSPVVMGHGSASGETVVRQFLLVRIGGINLNRALLLALGKEHGQVVFPLPSEWREILTRYDFKVAHFRSALLWKLYVGVFLLYGIFKIGKIAFAGLIFGKSKVFNKDRYVYFANLGPANLPKEKNGSQSHDIISWYLQWQGRKSDIKEIRHNVANSLDTEVNGIRILSKRGPLPALVGWVSIVKYAIWGLGAIIFAVFDCLRGRWWHALLLSEAALVGQVRILPVLSLAREYLFHNSDWIYRPLWTYEADQRGSEITFYFYSSCDEFKRPDGYHPASYGWKAMNWPRYLVWDDYQADLVRRIVGIEANISIVWPIWFQSSDAAMPQFNSPSVTIFDVSPMRQSRHSILLLDYDYYIPSTCEGFLSHILDATRHLDAVMLWKRKRKIGAMAHPRYRYFSEKLSEEVHVVLVDPDISAFRVIESSCAVISIPFTSTALIAKEMGKPSIYYDPTGLVQRDDRAAHGVPILSGIEELEEWISAQISIQQLIR